MKPTIYLACSSHEITRVQRWAAAIDALGYIEITSRWWVNCDWSGRDAVLTREQARDVAVNAISAIARANIVWVLVPRSLAGGSLVELGIAHAFAAHTPGRYVVATGNGCSRTAFTAACDVRDESDGIGLVAVAKRATEIRK